MWTEEWVGVHIVYMFAQVSKLFVDKSESIYHYSSGLCSGHHSHSLETADILHIAVILCNNQLQPLALIINLVDAWKLRHSTVVAVTASSLLVELLDITLVFWELLGHHVWQTSQVELSGTDLVNDLRVILECLAPYQDPLVKSSLCELPV